MSRRILLVDDDPLYAGVLFDALSRDGYETCVADCAADALAFLADGRFDVALLDVKLPDSDGLGLFREVRVRQPSCACLVITGHATVEMAVEAMRLGARDYVPKPFPTEVLLLKLRRLMEVLGLEGELETLRAKAGEEGVVGRSVAFERLLEAAETVAGTDANVLLQGESGTGKEVIAELIHRKSERRHGPLVKVNCGAIPENLMESELFGAEKGAFTGAENRRKGTLEQAHGGTLFLDEVGHIPLSMQVKLLRALQDRSIRRLGGETEVPVDFRLVTATNEPADALVARNVLRHDFYFRINVVPLEIPPLRQRVDDIPLLLAFFVQRYARAHDLEPIQFTPEALEALAAYPWPGNVRELQNLVERLQVLTPGEQIRGAHLPPAVRRAGSESRKAFFFSSPGDLTLKEAVRRFEDRYIAAVIAQEGGNKAAAARRLGVARETLWKKQQSSQPLPHGNT